MIYFQVDSWLDKWNINIENRKVCYRELHGALKDEQKRSVQKKNDMISIILKVFTLEY